MVDMSSVITASTTNTSSNSGVPTDLIVRVEVQKAMVDTKKSTEKLTTLVTVVIEHAPT